MKRKILLALLIIALIACFFTLSVSATQSNEFGAVETIENIDLTKQNKDMGAKMVIVNAKGEYHTYPSSYVLLDYSGSFYFDFNPISKALGETISKDSLIRFEVPNNIKSIPYGGLSACKNLLEIKFLEDSRLETAGGGAFYNNPELEVINLPASLKEFTGTQIFNMCYKLHTVTFAENSQLTKIPDSCFQHCKSLKKLVLPHSVTTLGNKLFDSSTVIEELYLSPNLVDFGSEHFAYKQSGTLKIFAPAQLFEGKDSVGIKDFSWWESDKCLPSMAIFITGTKAQADAIVAKSTYHKLTNATVSPWDSTKSTDDYTPASGWAIVYGYSVCDAFYGEHQMSEGDGVSFVDYFSEITVGNICTRQGCGVGVVKKTIAPIFAYLGVSTTESSDKNGKYSITVGYKVNYNSYSEYLEYGELEFGFVASVISVTGNDPLTVLDGKVAAKDEAKTIFAPQDAFAHDYLDLKVTGVSAEMNGESLVLGLYAYNGEEITYLGDPVSINIQ